MSTLPIYRLRRTEPDLERLFAVAEGLFGLSEGFKLDDVEGRSSLSRAPFVVEISTASGGIWAADESQLFNPELRPQLLAGDEAVSYVWELVESKKLLPELTGPAAWGEPIVAGTRLATRRGTRRTERDLDVQVVFPVTIHGEPVVGGGGDFTLVLGDGRSPLGFHGVWRDLGDSFESEVVSAEQAEEEFRRAFSTSSITLESVTTRLAYYSAPASERQEFLYPVYLLGGTGVVDDELVPLRIATLPATEFGPRREVAPPEPLRPKGARPQVSGQKEVRHNGAARRSYQTVGAAAALPASGATKPWEAGASWIGTSGGLAGSKKNAEGFIDGWRDDGWIIDFNWGDANVWESDWRRNDDLWVDNADFVFYTGHANMNGWTLASPDDGSLQFTEVGSGPATPGDLWGQSDLEWVTIAACGPLQDELLARGGGDVLARWDGAFDGLHLLMGYGAVTFDNESEGRQLSQYAREGQTLTNAWFRTAKEIQPATNGVPAPDGPTVWVGVMWVSKAGADPVNDHAWSHGSVSADPTSPTTLACMWTVC